MRRLLAAIALTAALTAACGVQVADRVSSNTTTTTLDPFHGEGPHEHLDLVKEWEKAGFGGAPICNDKGVCGFTWNDADLVDPDASAGKTSATSEGHDHP